MIRLLTLALILSIHSTSVAEEIRVLSWNVESAGNDAEVISETLEELQTAGEPYDLPEALLTLSCAMICIALRHF